MRHTVFVCQNCGYETGRWLGRCPNCGEWNRLVEEERVAKKRERPGRNRTALSGSKPQRLSELSSRPVRRQVTGIGELDRVLGGGLVPGSLLLLGGEPGIGKSTLMLQVCDRLGKNGAKVLYVSGEESAEQVRLRAERLGTDTRSLFVLCTVDLEEIVDGVQEVEPGLLVVDSIQSVFTANLTSAPGSVGQVRECTAELLRLAKSRTITTFVIGHVTKFGAIAGPKTLEHMVDTVLYFEGEGAQQYRIVRAVKNRFGSTNEIGVFEMTESGLTEVANPSEFFLSGRQTEVSGSAVVATIEGTRPLLVEVQALAAKTPYALPQRVATGFDYRRLSMLLCVLERRTGIATGGEDVFINVAGGLKIQEPAADLGILLAIASSIRNIPLPDDMVFFGEVGLGGEVRSVARAEGRITEAARLGFKRVVLPRRSLPGKKVTRQALLLPVASVREALEIVEIR
ncbi:MAG: DNA repair protein RadA [candidate division WOR-3 bacterium]